LVVEQLPKEKYLEALKFFVPLVMITYIEVVGYMTQLFDRFPFQSVLVNAMFFGYLSSKQIIKLMSKV